MVIGHTQQKSLEPKLVMKRRKESFCFKTCLLKGQHKHWCPKVTKTKCRCSPIEPGVVNVRSQNLWSTFHFSACCPAYEGWTIGLFFYCQLWSDLICIVSTPFDSCKWNIFHDVKVVIITSYVIVVNNIFVDVLIVVLVSCCTFVFDVIYFL